MSDETTEKTKPKTAKEQSDSIRKAGLEEEKPKEDPKAKNPAEPDGDEPPVEKEPTAPDPKAKTAQELEEDPKQAVNNDIVEEMGTEDKFYMDEEKAKSTWAEVTAGKEHKLGACMDAMKGKVDDPSGFCNWLANKNGYIPE
jgi:hypothetical protein